MDILAEATTTQEAVVTCVGIIAAAACFIAFFYFARE